MQRLSVSTQRMRTSGEALLPPQRWQPDRAPLGSGVDLRREVVDGLYKSPRPRLIAIQPREGIWAVVAWLCAEPKGGEVCRILWEKRALKHLNQYAISGSEKGYLVTRPGTIALARIDIWRCQNAGAVSVAGRCRVGRDRGRVAVVRGLEPVAPKRWRGCLRSVRRPPRRRLVPGR
jgi:hypothetical protein